MRCKICRTEFVKRSISHKVCPNPDCVVAWVEQEKARKLRKLQMQDRKETKLALAKLDPMKVNLKKLEKLVNLCVRLRDKNDGCISCDKPASWNGQWHASHYKSKGSNSALRFEMLNIHKSCSPCNRWLAGNIANYKPRLVEKIGQQAVDWLDNHPRSHEYTIEEVEELTKKFQQMKKEMENGF